MKKYIIVNLLALAMIGCGGGGSSKPKSSAAASSVAASSVATSASAASSSAEATWDLVWSDDFTGTSIDATKWGFEKNCWGGGNNEQQCYTDQATNAFVANGYLNIVANREDFTGLDSPEGTGTATKTLPYTSARLRTKNLAEWTFGKFEIRAKLPQGQGTWPAIWMLPTDSPYGGWAGGGEIDIMEAVNLKTQTSVEGVLSEPEARVYGTLHFGRAWPDNKSAGEDYIIPNSLNPADDFHTYSLEWEAGEIRWYVDGVHYSTQRETGWYSQYLKDGVLTDAPVGAPFDSKSKFHLLLNLAVGGAWAGAVNNKGIDATVFPQTMQVDYVKIYSCSASALTGKGCASVNPDVVPLVGIKKPKIATTVVLNQTFDIFTDAVAPAWDIGLFTYDNNSGAIKATIIDATETARGKVINVKYGATAGLAYIQTTDIVNASEFARVGSTLQFDLKVISYGTATGINVKADCGYPCTSGDLDQGKIADGVWQAVSIPIANLVSGGLDLTKLNTPIGISPKGTQDGVELQIDNVRWVLGTGEIVVPPVDAITGSFDIFTEAVDPRWDNGFITYDVNNSGAIATSIVESGDEAHGKVANIKFSATSGLAYFQSSKTKDASVFSSGGSLEFDVKVLSYGSAPGLVIKADCVFPCTSGDVSIGKKGDGVWEKVTVPIATLVAGGLKLNAVNTPFAIFPTWDKQAGVELQVDNVRWVK